jgi:membrane fusion protein (multidrug efflux system)
MPQPRTAAFAALSGVLWLAACGQGGQQKPPPPEVGIVVIQPQPAELTTTLPGRTSPYAVSDIRPQVSGILKARLFTEGSLVRKGQPLYQIDPAPYRAAYRNAAALLASTKAKAERYRALLAQKAVAPQDYDDAVAAYRQAEAATEAARINLGYTRIVAPIGGRIGRSSVTQGALVTADQPTALATIQTLDPIYVDITQSSSEIVALKLALRRGTLTNREPADAKTTLQLDNGMRYPLPGRLQFSEVSVDPATGSVALRAIFPNPDGLLLPGMFVRATVIEGVDPKAILAPQQGVSRNEKGEPTALVVDARGFARLRLLRTAQAIGDKWLVTKGLEPGDRLIVEGLQKVSPDMPVRAVPASFVKQGKRS